MALTDKQKLRIKKRCRAGKSTPSEEAARFGVTLEEVLEIFKVEVVLGQVVCCCGRKLQQGAIHQCPHERQPVVAQVCVPCRSRRP